MMRKLSNACGKIARVKEACPIARAPGKVINEICYKNTPGLHKYIKLVLKKTANF